MSMGILDACIPMNYSAGNSLFKQRLEDAARNQGARRIYMGVGAYMNPKENTVVQCAQVANRGLHGFNLYSYGTLENGHANHDRVLAFIKKKSQISWAATPDYPWKKKYGILKGAVTLDDKPLYNAVITVNSAIRLNQKTGAHGKFAFFDLPAGNYTATVSVGGKSINSAPLAIAAGRVDTIDFRLVHEPQVPGPRSSN